MVRIYPENNTSKTKIWNKNIVAEWTVSFKDFKIQNKQTS